MDTDATAAPKRLKHHAVPTRSGRHVRNKSSAASQRVMTPLVASEARPAAESTHTRKSSEESRHFIGNVGAGGRLYLSPSRLPIHQILPATPPRTLAPKFRGPLHDAAVSVPPLSLANVNRRHRSRSAGTIGIPNRDIGRAVTSGASQETEMNAREPPRMGLLDLEIPHHRLGTPRFSARGTAYLRSSVYTASTDDDQSSVMSQQVYDRLFPMPPGNMRRRSTSSENRPTHHLHPSSAARARLPRPQVVREPSASEIAAALFDQIETNYMNSANVRFAPEGQLLAASIPRLIAQITSPKFLDYELLSDFFLTYRGFLKCQDLLSWLIQRMRWAIDKDSDTGRIVRVRTFVALRHWVLNYFADDFLPSVELRQQFCESINTLAKELAARADRGPGDINILCELKKCWRRTSALYWPVADALEASAVADITPGAPLSTEETLRQSLQFDSGETAALQLPQLVAIDQRTNQKARVASVNSTASVLGPRASIPASPMSDESLQVLSCSVPFLSKVRPDASAEKRAERSAPRPAVQRRNSLSKQREHQIKSQHRRVGSEPVLSRKESSIDIGRVPAITLTGGLVRGIILQPCPPSLQRSAPRSPPLDGISDDYFDDSGHGSVKRIVGRVLSVKKSIDSTNRSHHASSRASSRDDTPSRLTQTSVPRSSISSTPRKDVLAGKIQKSYDRHFSSAEIRPIETQQGLRPLSLDDFAARLGSQITSGSRSIVIVDATSLPAPSPPLGDITQAVTMMPLFPSIMDAQRASDMSQAMLRPQQTRTTTSSQSIDGRLHESFVFPPPMKIDSNESYQTMTSTEAPPPSMLHMQVLPKQLRRVPGGDLRAADHVHELKDDIPTPELTLTRSHSTSSRKVPRSYSHRTAHSVAVTDASSSRPHVRSSFKSDAGRLAKLRADSETGGIEDALARLEGKPVHRRRHSGMSWLELPTNEETTESVHDGEQIGVAFEMVGPPAHPGQLYRLSKVDHSEDASLHEAVPVTYQAMRAHQHSSSRMLDAGAVASDTDTRRTDVTSALTQSSFLLDDNQSLSDISTDLGEQADTRRAGVRSFFCDDTHEDGKEHKPRPYAKDSVHDSTPSQSPELHPTAFKVATSAAKILGVPAGNLVPEILQHRPKRRRPEVEGHYPFVLAFESSVVAEQLCIIEKDALDEVDWKDLISLNWRQTPSQARNWADYLKHEDSNGIDLVVARFNLVVKWVVSQIILTDSTLERARCMTKFIHVAAHCLRLRNYASMTQITLALLSSDLARLTTTWSLVAPPDKRCLDHMEVLCQPLRNFANLRAEMENATLSDGCIPFIGLYTHDLMYNAQKPTTIEQQGDGNGLVNFERFQTAAMITKSLLRLLDASARYVFKPETECLSRCLWLAALEDAELGEIGLELE